LLVRKNEWDRAVEGHRVVELVLKHIQVVQTVRLRVLCIRALCVRQVERSRMLGNSVEVDVVDKGNVERDCLGTYIL